MRRDTLSHAYELMKVSDPRKRKRLADQVARNELSLAKLRERVDGRRQRPVDGTAVDDADAVEAPAPAEPEEAGAWQERSPVPEAIRDDSLVVAKQQLNMAVEDLLDVIRNPEVLGAIGPVDRTNLAKYLTIAKLRLENAIAVVRAGDTER